MNADHGSFLFCSVLNSYNFVPIVFQLLIWCTNIVLYANNGSENLTNLSKNSIPHNNLNEKKKRGNNIYFVALSIQYAFKDLVSLAASINSVQTDFIFSVTIHFNMGNEWRENHFQYKSIMGY